MPSEPILLHPKARGSDVFKDSVLWHLFTYCLLSAANEDATVAIDTGLGEKGIKLKRGEMVFSRKTASDATGIPQSTIRNKILKLIDAKTITIVAFQGYSIVTITNYERYQERKLSGKQPVQMAIFKGSDSDIFLKVIARYNRQRGILPKCLDAPEDTALFKKIADRKKGLGLTWQAFMMKLDEICEGCQEVEYYQRVWQPGLRWIMHSHNNLMKVLEKIEHAKETNTFQGR